MSDDAESLRREIAALERRQTQLTTLLGEFDHELRRGRDALERAGGRSRDVEAKIGNMREGLEQSKSALAENTRRIDELKRRLQRLTGEIA
jgi:chromosome segregation ATPase